ncbi:MAG: SPOR domain-containing protein [Candidatus Omnitrophica bacterium]|nr:SPOR domain-containing protein [Candidatus Omnitrophota bacterium]MCM8826056.1 SPOR domain-containing protein [Candidatus Omnitrophota bacterium]
MLKLISKCLLFWLILIYPLFLYPDTLSKVKEAYLRGEYNEAKFLCLDELRNNLNANTLYFAGIICTKLGEFSEARSYFRRILQDFKDSKLYEQTLIKLADTYFLEGNWERSEGLYKDILNRYPHINYKPLVYLRLAQVSAKKGNWDDKNKYLKIIKENYYSSVESKIAEELQKMDNFFTVQIGAFSNRSNALALLKEVSYKYPAYLVEDREESLIFYKVRVGKYVDRLQAESTFYKLKEEGYPARIYP